MLTFYFIPGTSSMATHIALHEVGAAFDAHALSFKREERPAEFVALGPEGQVPVLVVDGRPITEVAATLFYLAKRFPEARLLPQAGIEHDAWAISWMSFIASTLHPARFRGDDHIMAVYGIADERLGSGIWALGDYSIVDIHLFRLFWRLSGSFDIPSNAFPHLKAHHDRMMERGAVKRTIEIESKIGYAFPTFVRGNIPAGR